MSFYDEVEIEDMSFDPDTQKYTYPCPCGDRFEITVEELREGEDVARCPSCSLILRVVYDEEDFMDEDDEGETMEVPGAIVTVVA
ncbi:zf-CSL-domain-containing protein [Saitoella complicata NRRL Y-17804]|uniref:zf-CSL-domain-containing protein n=1 Tax=Saitoella complicata (strain BCRC 22490 / CBS 7301 / JCM 7358 / NBRC 10748 / NRRL Y-17804) TaxID=698492 RepID=UPI000867ECAB|nr:zf-CSL-domain-containing protein [Saitoella complicata NRRL Y-17804]ODQ52202.1 zf-CSL-domain-containing protein [Saitoella complicata NRRL Y-17804]